MRVEENSFERSHDVSYRASDAMALAREGLGKGEKAQERAKLTHLQCSKK
jgi:hypothetical protein